MREVTIAFLAVEGSPYLTQDPPWSMSIIDVTSAGDPSLYIVGVSLNGKFLKIHRATGTAQRVWVSPAIPYEADRVAIRCLSSQETPQEPSGDAQRASGTYPLTQHQYGLQRPV